MLVCPHMHNQCSSLSWKPQVKITQYAKEKNKRELVEHKYGSYLESLRGSLVPSWYNKYVFWMSRLAVCFPDNYAHTAGLEARVFVCMLWSCWQGWTLKMCFYPVHDGLFCRLILLFIGCCRPLKKSWAWSFK